MKISLRGYGALFCIGLFIQITTSVTWMNITPISTGETYFMLGQAIGELCYIFTCRRLFEKHGLFVAVTEFAIALILIDIFTILVLNPYEVSLSKYMGFVIAFIICLIRIKKYLK